MQVGATQADFVLSHSAADAQVATTSQPVRCALQIWSTAGFSGSQRRSPTAHSGVWQMFSSPSYLLSQSPAVAHWTEVKLWPSAEHVLSVALFGSHQTELGLQLLQRWFAASQNVGQVWLLCVCPSARAAIQNFPGAGGLVANVTLLVRRIAQRGRAASLGAPLLLIRRARL